jgi:hypothetical protein
VAAHPAGFSSSIEKGDTNVKQIEPKSKKSVASTKGQNKAQGWRTERGRSRLFDGGQIAPATWLSGRSRKKASRVPEVSSKRETLAYVKSIKIVLSGDTAGYFTQR